MSQFSPFIVEVAFTIPSTGRRSSSSRRSLRMASRLNSATIKHSGFADLVNLFTSPPSGLSFAPQMGDRAGNAAGNGRSGAGRDRGDLVGIPYEAHRRPETFLSPTRPARKAPARQGNGGQGRDQTDDRLRRRKIAKHMIGPPTDFRWAPSFIMDGRMLIIPYSAISSTPRYLKRLVNSFFDGRLKASATSSEVSPPPPPAAGL